MGISVAEASGVIGLPAWLRDLEPEKASFGSPYCSQLEPDPELAARTEPAEAEPALHSDLSVMPAVSATPSQAVGDSQTSLEPECRLLGQAVLISTCLGGVAMPRFWNPREPTRG